MRSRILALALSGQIFALTLLAGCQQHTAEEEKGPPVVRVVKPTEAKITDYEQFTGRTEGKDSVEIRARVSGYLDKYGFKEGAEVKKDDVLFVIDRRPYKAALDSEEGKVKLAKARLKLAKADYARARVIARTPGAISQQDVDKYAAAEAEAYAAVDAAEANAESARLNYQFTEVKSPIDGQVGRYLLTLGNLVTQDQSLLTTVVSLDPMYAYFDVDERTMLRIQQLIREGKIKASSSTHDYPVELGLADEGDRFPHKGVINFVNNQVDPNTGTIQVRGTFPNPMPKRGGDAARLYRPGMFVRVRLPIGGEHKALLVPQAALGTDQGQKYLLVVNDKNVVEYRPVNLGSPQPGGMQEILPIKIVHTKEGTRPSEAGEKGEDSLKPGDRVVVSGLQRIRPGVTVAPKPYREQ
jgi:multidrug efflux system membrane fusion protein